MASLENIKLIILKAVALLSKITFYLDLHFLKYTQNDSQIKVFILFQIISQKHVYFATI